MVADNWVMNRAVKVGIFYGSEYYYSASIHRAIASFEMLNVLLNDDTSS